MSGSSYILGESTGESERLRAQAGRHPVRERLVWAGLGAGARVVDAGCGPGEVSRIAAALAGPDGHVVGFDQSAARLEVARAAPPAPGSAPIEFRTGDLLAPPVADGEADFVVCQYVLEYVAERARAVKRLAALLRPGGVLCLVDADHIGQIFSPAPPELEEGLATLRRALAATGFDAHTGRRLFSLALEAGLADVAVRPEVIAFAGAAPDSEIAGWEQRLVALAPVGHEAMGEPGWERFCEVYLRAMRDPGVLKYDVIFTIRGARR